MLSATKTPAPRTATAWTPISLQTTGASVPSPPVTSGAEQRAEEVGVDHEQPRNNISASVLPAKMSRRRAAAA